MAEHGIMERVMSKEDVVRICETKLGWVME